MFKNFAEKEKKIERRVKRTVKYAVIAFIVYAIGVVAFWSLVSYAVYRIAQHFSH